MTCEELINKLSDYPKDSRVIVTTDNGVKSIKGVFTGTTTSNGVYIDGRSNKTISDPE